MLNVRAFLIKKGTEVTAVNFKQSSSYKLDKKVIKRDTMYSIEDIGVDPLGKVGAGPNSNTIGGQWARQGLYGFILPENTQGYELMLVHGTDIEVH
jgi:hypothetical protein